MSPTGPPPPPLSARERLALETMVHHECRHDPAFVERLTSWSAPPDRTRPERARRARAEPAGVVAVLGILVVVGVLVGLAVGGQVVLAVAATVVLLVAPVALLVWALGQAGRRP